MLYSAAKTVFTLLGLTIGMLYNAAGIAAAVTIHRSYHYYTISAQTIDGLQKAINLHGPYIQETGHHHAAASLISFKRNIKTARKNAYCRVEQADILIYVKIYLPQWKQRQILGDSNITRFWDTLLRDIKQHEETHILIARRYGNEMEQELRSLPYKHNCEYLQKDIDTVLQRLVQKNDAAQIKFDYIEGKNFKKRLEKILQKARQKSKTAADISLHGQL